MTGTDQNDRSLLVANSSAEHCRTDDLIPNILISCLLQAEWTWKFRDWRSTSIVALGWLGLALISIWSDRREYAAITYHQIQAWSRSYTFNYIDGLPQWSAFQTTTELTDLAFGNCDYLQCCMVGKMGAVAASAASCAAWGRSRGAWMHGI